MLILPCGVLLEAGVSPTSLFDGLKVEIAALMLDGQYDDLVRVATIDQAVRVYEHLAYRLTIGLGNHAALIRQL